MDNRELESYRKLVLDKNPPIGKRTWGEDRCDECCNGDRCDDPTHYDREHCPFCLGTGYALWLPKFRGGVRWDYLKYSQM